MPNILIVFDLDFTLWDAGGTWCDHLCPPFLRNDKWVVDAHGARIRLYPAVHRVLDHCDTCNIPMALASRTGAPAWARDILDLFALRNRFAHEQIYPGSKVHHFRCLQQESGLPFERMAFLDDEMRNIHEVEALGVHTIHVPEGLTWNHFQSALASVSQD